jgi:hypothetical protein
MSSGTGPGGPWLQTAERALPEALRIIVAADQGGGHGHIRHEGWVTEEASMRRAAYLEDPAQVDPDRRRRGIDGLRPAGTTYARPCPAASPTLTPSPPPSPAAPGTPTSAPRSAPPTTAFASLMDFAKQTTRRSRT